MRPKGSLGQICSYRTNSDCGKCFAAQLMMSSDLENISDQIRSERLLQWNPCCMCLTRVDSSCYNVRRFYQCAGIWSSPISFHVGEHHFRQDESGGRPVHPSSTQSLFHLGRLSNIHPQQLVLASRHTQRSCWSTPPVRHKSLIHDGRMEMEANGPVTGRRWGPNTSASVGLPWIRAALRLVTSGKSTSNTTAPSRAPSACKRKYSESKPAPRDRIYTRGGKDTEVTVITPDQLVCCIRVGKEK